MAQRVLALLAALTTAAGIGAFGALAPASAQAPPDTIVAESPTANTPNVLDGAVRTIAQIGDTVFIGGTFLQVAPPGSTNGTSRPFLAAFDADTGQIDTGFTAGLDGTVNKIVPAPDGNSIYIGGSFNDVDDVRSKSVARLDATTGERVAGFSPPAINGTFWDMELVGDRLIVGGNFIRVGGNDRTAVASLNAQTGAFDPYVNLGVSGVHNSGTTNVRTLAVRPDGAELVIGGNFREVAGQTRRQVAVVDLGAEAALSGWATTRFEPRCHPAFNTYLRDIEYSPDGGYFVVATTGAAFQNTMCDAASRWESGRDGPGQQPTWVSYTGGDTLTGLEITDSVVYAGGHQRWMNNPFGSDFPGRGAVERSGIAALDPRNGVPFSWDPGRPRGYGVWDFLTTSEGMYVGHDTNRLGGFPRERIGLLPHAAGTQLPPDEIGGLPNDVIHVGGLTVAAIPFDGSDAGDPQTVDDDSSWLNARAATMIDDTLFVARSNGTLTAQTFDGETFGSPSTVDLNNIPEFQTDLAMMTGMFFDPDDGRLYFTRTGSNTLFYRAFTPESRIVDSRRETASGSAPGFTPSLVRGMFLADGQLYFANSTGELRVVGWDGGPSGSAAVANGSRDWRGALFLRPGGGPPPPPPNEPPVAAFSYSCVELSCEYDASDSTDSDGEVVDYAWDFGDGATGSGATVEHTYGASYTYDVTLTVTDDDDATDATTVSVAVSDEVAELAFRANASANGNGVTRQVTVPGDVEAGDGMLLFVTQNGSAELSEPEGWTLVESHDGGGLTSTLYQREATEADPGSVVAVTSPTIQKINMELLAYAATAAAPVADYAVVTEEKFLTEHSSPSVDVAVPGAWAVTFFADKSSSTESWTEPAGAATRSISIGSGGGRLTSLAADSGGPVGSPYGGLVAQTNAPSSSSVAWTVVVAPGSELAAQGAARSKPSS
jgi:PKD repeat protein